MRAKRNSYIINLVGILLLFGLVQMLMAAGVVKSYYLGILIMCQINIILAVSLNLTTGFLGQLALGHAGFMAVGAYAAALFSIHTGITSSATLPLSLIVGGLCAAVFGLVIGIPALRLKGDYLAIITLGFGEIIRVIINNLSITGGARGLRKIPMATTFTNTFFVMVIVVALLYTLGRSRHGRAILSIREDEVAAEAAGIPTTRYKVFAFTLAAFFAGVAGGLYSHYMGILDPKNFGFTKSIEYLVMVVLGGMGSISGSIISAFVLTLLPEVLRGFSEYRMLVYSLLLILMMLFRPSGLMGTGEISISGMLRRVFRGREKPEGSTQVGKQ